MRGREKIPRIIFCILGLISLFSLNNIKYFGQEISFYPYPEEMLNLNKQKKTSKGHKNCLENYEKKMQEFYLIVSVTMASILGILLIINITAYMKYKNEEEKLQVVLEKVNAARNIDLKDCSDGSLRQQISDIVKQFPN